MTLIFCLQVHLLVATELIQAENWACPIALENLFSAWSPDTKCTF